MTNKPQITVYIVNHNYGRYLKEAIQSVLTQSERSFEILIIDNGSDDNSYKILEEYKRNPLIKIIKQKNYGLTVSINLALSVARGKYIIRLDADDFLAKDALLEMKNKLDKDKFLAMVFPDYYIINSSSQIIEQIQRHNFMKDVSLKNIPAHGACSMFRINVLKQVGGYDEEFNRQDGYSIWLKLYSQFKIENINKPLFYYRRHSKNITKDEVSLFSTRANILKKHLESLKLKPFKVLVIIPFRGTSIDYRSLPLKKLGNKKLIDWTISETIKNPDIDSIIVSTPDQKVNNYIKKNFKNKIKFHNRPIEEADINVSLTSTVKSILEEFNTRENPIDAVAILNIDAPFRKSVYISKAIYTMRVFNADTVISARLDSNMFYKHNGKSLVPNQKNSDLRLERHNLFRQSGGIILVRCSFFKKTKKIIGGIIAHIDMDELSAFTIRSSMDWNIANYLASYKIL